jgi:hypothetical protein
MPELEQSSSHWFHETLSFFAVRRSKPGTASAWTDPRT